MHRSYNSIISRLQELFVKHWPPARSRCNTCLGHERLGYPETIYALMNVGRTWWKATQKVLEHYLHLTQCMLPKFLLNDHCLKFCSPDSYSPCNSCWNKYCYIIMCISVVCPSHIGCRSVWLKSRPTPNGSGLLPLPQPLYAIAKISKWQSTSN